jgi:transposase
MSQPNPLSDYVPQAHRRTVERLAALAPHRAAEFWNKWNTEGISKAEAQKLIAELTAAREEQRLPAQPAEVKLAVLAQVAQRTREEIDAEMEREVEQRKRLYAQTVHTWTEQQYANRQQAEAWRHRYDPCGLWGEATLASELD